MSNPDHMLKYKNHNLEVIEYAGQDKNKRYLWRCLCRCGKIKILSTWKIKVTKSCGCLKNAGKHGLSSRKFYHPLYRMWDRMIQRCTSLASNKFPYYGKKGIKVCDEWINNPQAFYDFALINGWKDGLTIDRINSDKNYEPTNVRFITKEENSRNAAKKRFAIKTGSNLICIKCDKIYYRMLSKVKNSKYCSRSCAVIDLPYHKLKY